MVVGKWSAYSPSTPSIIVQILPKFTYFSAKKCFKSTKINKKELGIGPKKKEHGYVLVTSLHYLQVCISKMKLFAWKKLVFAFVKFGRNSELAIVSRLRSISCSKGI